ncbi:MAG: membrane protein insertion efficiency factor YidD, partial [Oligoflexia bacterium]|nr:membrane protein insertion efficiency factor YidD [Oligoflexia bacterium]
ILIIYIYRIFNSLLLYLFGINFRFYPSCSEYSLQCFKTLPLHWALWYTVKRLLRCHPMSEGGYDPIPKM